MCCLGKREYLLVSRIVAEYPTDGEDEIVIERLNTRSEVCPVDSGSLPTIEFKPGVYLNIVKPVFDRTAAALGLVALALPMLGIALLVRLSMGNPVLFRQRRVGRDGREFDVLKFRTMNADRRSGDEQSVPADMRRTHKSDADPRHTAVGRWLRRLSLDELPQLINVLKGEMSLIGPRPELVEVVAKHYTDELHQRHLVKPGLTGLWQVSARGDGAMHENGGWDIVYVQRASALTDLRILLRTPLVIFGSRAGQ